MYYECQLETKKKSVAETGPDLPRKFMPVKRGGYADLIPRYPGLINQYYKKKFCGKEYCDPFPVSERP